MTLVFVGGVLVFFVCCLGVSFVWGFRVFCFVLFCFWFLFFQKGDALLTVVRCTCWCALRTNSEEIPVYRGFTLTKKFCSSLK